ncbi:MAG: DUF952 domain-containing protein [Pseudomonadota bacterium]
MTGASGPDGAPSGETVAYKILTADQWAAFQAAGEFAGAPIDLADGYIHMSAAAQLQGTLEAHFAGQSGLVIATIDLAPLGDDVVWEASRGGALFPHLYYRSLPLSVVTETRIVDT